MFAGQQKERSAWGSAQDGGLQFWDCHPPCQAPYWKLQASLGCPGHSLPAVSSLACV